MEEAKQRFLHGTLEATIFHATPYTPPFPLNCILANGKPTYVTIRLNNKKVARTTHETDRLWNQTFHILCAHPADSTLTLTLETSCSVLGKINFRATQFLDGSSLVHGFFPLEPEDKKSGSGSGSNLRLQLILWFKPAGSEPGWEKLIAAGGGHYKGLQNCSFPQRSHCHVSLYQDAHHLSSFRPPIDGLCKNGNPSPRRLWEDVFKAIESSKYFVYIVGWSLNPKLVLVRDTDTDIPHAVGVTLGELLKRKAEEGVAVRILLWDDETSLPIIKNKGVMGTHDEDASAYFRHTKVECKLCPRLHNKFPTVFAHHQKTITLDTHSSHSGSTLREVTSFVGGLDMCDGRYDTEEHSLFRTLNSDFHSHDFYQTNIPGANPSKGGPRAPWHDTHALVRGEAAWDILTNFEQRWAKQCNNLNIIPARSMTGLVQAGPHPDWNWNVQVFRSIDHVSTTQKSPRVEQNIHEAYVDSIRRAERFIYIENQYFIGGCHLWARDSNSGCSNLIPVEIALKVASKIKAKERFAVYVVIPMWPEGVPESDSVQDILHWTRETMQMMYGLIGEAIRESGENGHPSDYLNFFCLANREVKRDDEVKPPSSPRRSTQYWNAQKHRRFMVYVHSKLMIVDDAYLLIGSANINQRSMDGQRDTEIAIGCHQNNSHGDIRTYRMSLWYEHTKEARELFLKPESLECVSRVRAIGDQMWKIYSGEEVVDMEGVHLVSYPIHVTEDGSIEDVGGGTFPDTKAPVRGRRSRVLPSIITT